MNSLDELYKKATDVMQHAYAPYSHFHVGACIETKSGNIYTGCNVENASYGLTICAEASAIANMVSAGDTEIKQITVMIEGPQLASPCGACRQRLMEFGTPDTPVHVGNKTGERATYRLQDLLPHAFSKANLL